MKIQCACGAKYAFEPTPEMAKNPVQFICPQCGLDSSEIVNQLVQESLAEQNLPSAPPPPDAPSPPPKPAPARLKISPAVNPPQAAAAPDPAPATVYSSKYCSKHPGIPATSKCMACNKPICPQCMQIFGFFCSPLCKEKAGQKGIHAPEYSGQRFAVERRFWRRTGLISGFLGILMVSALAFWIWYAWFASVPHVIFSAPFADDDRAYAGSAHLAPDGQLIFLHGATLARYDLASMHCVWSRNLIDTGQVQTIVQQIQTARAIANQQSEGDSYVHIPLPSADERHARIELQSALTLGVSGRDVWVASPDGIFHYDWATGKLLKFDPLPSDFPPSSSPGGGLLAQDGKPLDPQQVAEQAQNLNLPARIALPALLGNASYEDRLEAALRDTDNTRPTPPPTAPGTVLLSRSSLVGGPNGLIRFSIQELKANFVTREAMRPAGGKSVLNDANMSVAQTSQAANEILNEMQRNRGGDTVTEDQSLYQVTLHLPGSPTNQDWSAAVTGFPQFFALKTVNVVAAGQSVFVLDPSNHLLWQTSMTYAIPTSHAGQTSRFGAGPVVEHQGILYIYDQALLAAFDIQSGQARWRLPSVGIVGLFFDDDNNLFVNTTTGNPDDIRYSRQIDITRSTSDVLLKIDPVAGRILWKIQPQGFVAYLSGRFMYTLQDYDPNPTDEDVLNDSLVDLEKPPFLRITRLDPGTGRELWDHEQDRCPVDVQFDGTRILLVFKKEVQVLGYWVIGQPPLP